MSSAKTMLKIGMMDGDDAMVIEAIKQIKVADLKEFITSLDEPLRLDLQRFIADMILSLTCIHELCYYNETNREGGIARDVTKVVREQAKLLGFAYPDKYEVLV